MHLTPCGRCTATVTIEQTTQTQSHQLAAMTRMRPSQLEEVSNDWYTPKMDISTFQMLCLLIPSKSEASKLVVYPALGDRPD